MSGLIQGTVLGGYEIEALLGSGGMGVVYRARQLSLDRRVALKVVSPSLTSDPTFVERFRDEAVLAASLEHPHVVPVYERGEDRGHLFIAMRLIAGDDLRTRVERDGPLAPEQAVAVIGQIASALDAAHLAGLVHRDVKPANVLLTGDGAELTAFLSDFGIARRSAAPTHLTATGMLVGTPGYLAPEVIRGEGAGPPADIYALGCVLFGALTGSEPFARDDPTLTLAAHLTDPPPRSNAIVPALNDVLHRAMSKSPGDRFSTAAELADAARVALDGAVAADAPTVRSPAPPPAPRSTLPPSGGPIVGRAAELSELVELVQDQRVRLVTLTGSGGIGKTRLALALAEELREAFPDGAYWTALATATSPLAVLSSIAQTLDVREGGSMSLLEQITERLDYLTVLLILDNLEQALDASTSIAELVGYCPNLTVLVTSRAPLRVSVEREYPVDPLDTDSAAELFGMRATAVRPGFTEAGEVAEICAKLDRVPLAIELCAARVKLMTPQSILARLDQHAALSLLGAGPRDAPAHQRTLRATLDWSYALLGTHEQALFTRLAVFAGGFTLEATEAVCEAELDVLAALVDGSLVRFDDGRYSMLQTVTEYTRELLVASDELGPLSRRHAEWCLALAETNIEPFLSGGDQQAAAQRLALERDNIAAALEFSRDAGHAEPALRLAHATGLHSYFTGMHLELGLRQLGATLAAFDAPLGPWAATAHSAGWLAFELTLLDQARHHGEAALALRDELSSKLVIETLNLLGAIATSGHDAVRARARFEEALGVARGSGERHLTVNALTNLGYLDIEHGALEEARVRLEQARDIAGDADDAHSSAAAAVNLGLVSVLDDRPDASIMYLDDALRTLPEGQALILTAHAYAVLALAAAQTGDHRSCARLLGLVDAISDRTGVSLQPIESDVLNRAASMSSTALGDAFDAERERARDVAADEAASYALELAGQLVRRLGC